MAIETSTSTETGAIVGPARIIGSLPFNIDPSDIKSIGRNVLVYGLGLIAAYITTTVIPQIDSHGTSGMISLVVFGGIVDFIHKFTTNTTAAVPVQLKV